MSRTILRRRRPEPLEIPPLPVRLSGTDLRRRLARFGQPVTTRLGPGERMIGGRVFYSAAWLGSDVGELAEGEAMSRRDYQAHATMIREVAATGGDEGTLLAVAERTARVFAADNPAFDPVKFYTACGFEVGVTSADDFDGGHAVTQFYPLPKEA